MDRIKKRHINTFPTVKEIARVARPDTIDLLLSIISSIIIVIAQLTLSLLT